MGTIDLNDLSLFAAVVESGSFSAAASQLGLPKSSVSRAIARLEQAMDVRLLHRTTRHVAPSAAGRAFYEKISAEIASLRRAVRELPELEEELSGRVRVTAVADMADFFAEVVTRFVRRHPAVEIDLRLTNDFVDLVREGIDVALRFSTRRLKDSSLNAKKLWPSDVQLYAAPSYLARKGTPRTPRDLEDHEWVVYRRKVEIRLEGGGPPVQVVTRGRVICDDLGFLRAALVNGCGIGYLGGFQADEDIAAGRLVRVLPRWKCPISELWAVWPGPRKPPRKVSAFLETLLDTLRAHPLSLPDEAP